ncbi:hypothetical protein [Chamaesiphon sp.]|uniref:hypothetical protein n=1 Tax=Chamaesiphon sp. TaxID=2814140 RepID=UPI003593428F
MAASGISIVPNNGWNWNDRHRPSRPHRCQLSTLRLRNAFGKATPTVQAVNSQLFFLSNSRYGNKPTILNRLSWL